MLEIEKKESKTLDNFQKLLQQISQSPHTIRAGMAREVEKVFRGNYQELARHIRKLVPYLKNSSEETIFGCNKIKEQHESMKLQNEFHSKP